MRTLSLTSRAPCAASVTNKLRHVSCSRPRAACVKVVAKIDFEGELEASETLQRLRTAAVAVAAAAWLVTGSPAAAEIQTVSASDATKLAKPLQQQPVNKNGIWLLMVLGGGALFGSTVVLENNEKLFPAIYKANRAMSAAKNKQQPQQPQPAVDVEYELQQEQQRLAAVQAEREMDARQQAAFLAGLQEARSRSSAAAAAAPGAPAEAAVSPNNALLDEALSEGPSVGRPQNGDAEAAAAAAAPVSGTGREALQHAPNQANEADEIQQHKATASWSAADDGEESDSLQGMTVEQLEAALKARKARDAAAAQ